MLLQHKGNTTGKLSFKPEEEIEGTSGGLMVFHLGYAPWNHEVVRRKTQIAAKLSPKDVQRGWGLQHLSNAEDLQRDYELFGASAADLIAHPHANRAIARTS